MIDKSLAYSIRREEVPHAERIYNSLRDESASGRSALLASWMRSLRHYGLEPDTQRPPNQLSGVEFDQVRDRNAALLLASAPVLDRLALAVRRPGYCVLLTDPHGVTLEKRCDVGDEDTFARWGLTPAMLWDEAHEGTNGIGTCLAEDRALTIHRDQHFYTRNTPLSCTMAPIHDPQGRVAGGVDISICDQESDGRAIALLSLVVEDAARRIERRLFSELFSERRIVSFGVDGQALFALDDDEVIVGANKAARVMFRCCNDSGVTLPDLLSVSGHENPAHAAHAAIQRMLKRCGGNVSAAARELGISRATLHRKIKRHSSTSVVAP
ncbi:helix-turn-helix domain-containing protein [Acetobacter sacchari]